jgi:hypothetical protein
MRGGDKVANNTANVVHLHLGYVATIIQLPMVHVPEASTLAYINPSWRFCCSLYGIISDWTGQ